MSQLEQWPPPDLVVGERIGAGRRCEVFAGRWRRIEVVIKHYRREAIDHHGELADLPIAAFEYGRNQDCYSLAGLSAHVARPLGYHVAGDGQWLVQQRLHGHLCSDIGANWPAATWGKLRARLAALVALAHQAGIHDLDLHPCNVMMVRTAAGLEPALFDFNLVPFTTRRRPTLDGWLYRFGLIDAAHRDLRRLRRRFRSDGVPS